MAWTSSAGPQGTCVLAKQAANENVHMSGTTARQAGLPGKARPLALAATAHLCGFAIIAPFAAEEPIIVLPVLIGMIVSYFSLSRPDTTPASRLTGNVRTQQPTSPQANTFHVKDAANVRHIAPRKLKPAEMPDDLRAELMARVSHELRTPLNAVMGFSDLMGHQMFGPLGHPRYEEYVGHIRESSKKLLKSAEDTLAMTSLMAKSAQNCDREAIPLGDLAHEACRAIVADLRRSDIAIAIDIDRDIEVNAHRRALRQTLINVLHEAVNQAEAGATLSITATSDLDKVAFLITADRVTQSPTEAQHSLPLCLARTLLELDGCSLFENPVRNAPWSVLLSLDGAIQPDFFTSTTRAVMHAH